MIERSRSSRFLLEAAQPVRIVGHKAGQHFDCNIALQSRIPRPIYLSHSPRPEGCHNLVRPKLGPGSQRHMCEGLYVGCCRKRDTPNVLSRRSYWSELKAKASRLPVGEVRKLSASYALTEEGDVEIRVQRTLEELTSWKRAERLGEPSCPGNAF